MLFTTILIVLACYIWPVFVTLLGILNQAKPKKSSELVSIAILSLCPVINLIMSVLYGMGGLGEMYNYVCSLEMSDK